MARAAPLIPASLDAPFEEWFDGPWVCPPPWGQAPDDAGFGDPDVESDSETVASMCPQAQRGLAADAQTLLAKYLPGTYSPTQSEGVQAKRFFRPDTPARGIPLTEDFKAAYGAAAASAQPAGLIRKDFAFSAPDTLAFFDAKSFSPDLTHLAGRLGVNFKSCSFQLLDKPVKTCEAQTRSGLRLTAYVGSLLSLRARSRDLLVSEADKMILDEVLLAVTGALWTQLSVGAALATNLRREFALSSLGVLKRDVPALLAGVPSSEGHLFGGQFAAILQLELDARKQAAEIAKQLRPLRAPQPPKQKANRPFQRRFVQAPPRVPAPAVPQPMGGLWQSRGRASVRGRGRRQARGRAPARPRQSF